MRRITIAVAAVFVAAMSSVGLNPSAAVAAPATAAAPEGSPAGNVLARWGATMGGSQTISAAQAITDAQTVGTLVGLPGTFSQYTAAMRAANPALKMIFYMNGVYATGAGSANNPESWYLHDANGKRVTSTQFGSPLMDPTNPGWIQSRVTLCANTLATTGWDGCYLDMLGAGTLTPGYLSSTPIDPATGSAWTYPQWIAATTNLAATVSQALPGVYLVGNGLGDGAQFFSPSWGPSSSLLGPLTGVDAQGFVRGATDPATSYRSESQWKSDVDMLVAAGVQGKAVLVEAKVWSTGATPAQVGAIHRYALATFMLGTNGNQLWYWSDTGSESAVIEDTPYDHVNIGTPLAPYAKMLGAYQRPYSGGLVVVNPTALPVTIPLGAGQWTSLTGTVFQSQITLAPDTGDVLAASQPWGPVASVTTDQATNITPTSATVAGDINANGQDTTATAEFGTTATLGTLAPSVAAGIATAVNTVAITLTGLKPGTTYTYHVDATNSAGTAAGTNLTFTTALPTPTVKTTAAVVSGTTATVSGSVNPNGVATTYQVQYGPTTAYGSASAAQSAGSGTSVVAENVALAGLPVGTTHYRYVATSSSGTTYGLDKTARIR